MQSYEINFILKHFELANLSNICLTEIKRFIKIRPVYKRGRIFINQNPENFFN